MSIYLFTQQIYKRTYLSLFISCSALYSDNKKLVINMCVNCINIKIEDIFIINKK